MKTRYYCENCGNEVRAGAPVCPSCGRVFTAVRCPRCGFEGQDSEFAAGCPSCGFLVKTPKPGGKDPSARASAAPKRQSRAFSPLFYRVAAVLLLALVVVLLVILFRT